MAEAGWSIGSHSIRWQVKGEIQGPTDVSGVAQIGHEAGFVVSDETWAAQAITLDRATRTLTISDSLILLSRKKKELDLEGLAASSDEHFFYATGSHSVARKSGEVQPERRQVYRITADQAHAITVTSLVPVIESDPMLRDASGKGSNADALDIEGIAERDGTLFFGLRAPNIAGKAFIIEVLADDLFSDAAKTAHRTHELSLGAGFGIRDIARVSDGFVLIVGPASSDESAHGFTLHHWAGPGGVLTAIGDIPDAEGKAEGLLVLEEDANSLTALLFFDGSQNGAPAELQCLKPGRK